MPAYEFQCRSCGHRFTVNVPVKDRDKVLCEHCQGKELQQVYSSFNFAKSSCGGGSGGKVNSGFS